jgi:hypothetical protein
MPRPQITRNRPYTFKRGQFAGQTFTSEHAYRAALATARGRRRGQGIRTVSGYLNLRPSARMARGRALDALSRMRRQRLSLSSAARAAGTTPANVSRHAGAAIKKSGQRNYVASSSDMLFRRMHIITMDGTQVIDVKNSRDASLIAQHFDAVGHFLDTGDDSRLKPFNGRSVKAGSKSYEFLTDLDELERLGRAGEFSFESIYENAA